MAGLDGLTNRNVSYSSDSRRVPATVLGELMPARFHMDGAYDSVGNAYALLRRLADAKALHNPILHMPARSGCPACDETALTVVANVSQETVRALRILWVDPRRGHSKAPAGWTFAKQQQAVTMSRPTKTLVHDGEEWLAMLTGGDTSRQECTASACSSSPRQPTGRHSDACAASLLRGLITLRRINSERHWSPRYLATRTDLEARCRLSTPAGSILSRVDRDRSDAIDAGDRADDDVDAFIVAARISRKQEEAFPRGVIGRARTHQTLSVLERDDDLATRWTPHEFLQIVILASPSRSLTKKGLGSLVRTVTASLFAVDPPPAARTSRESD